MAASQATQEFVPVKEIREGIVTLKDGSLRAVLLASSVNFALKSTEEQQAIILQFQNFLNGLDFSIQICIQSRDLDIRPYIALLEGRYKNEVGDLMKIQIREYIKFVKSFVEQTNIMTKTFFIVIPFSEVVTAESSKNALSGLLGGKKSGAKTGASDNFEELRSQLEQRISAISQGLTRCGIRTIQLGTQEVTELFYKTFNPGELDKPMMPQAGN